MSEILFGGVDGRIKGLQSYAPRDKNPNMNCICVTVGTLRLYYSYQTLIAVANLDEILITGNNNQNIRGPSAVVSQNAWGNTTGKHLRYVKEDLARGSVPCIVLSHESFEYFVRDLLAESTLDNIGIYYDMALEDVEKFLDEKTTEVESKEEDTTPSILENFESIIGEDEDDNLNLI